MTMIVKITVRPTLGIVSDAAALGSCGSFPSLMLHRISTKLPHVKASGLTSGESFTITQTPGTPGASARPVGETKMVRLVVQALRRRTKAAGASPCRTEKMRTIRDRRRASQCVADRLAEASASRPDHATAVVEAGHSLRALMRAKDASRKREREIARVVQTEVEDDLLRMPKRNQSELEARQTRQVT